MIQKMKQLRNVKFWCYCAPDGNIQVRSIGETKHESREMLFKYSGYTVGWRTYEENGYFLKRIVVTITEHIKLSKR